MSLELIDMKLDQSGNKVFKSCTIKEKGLTVFERLKICEDNTNVNACIRLSSSYFTTSSYFYHICCGLDPPYNISELVEIA